MSGGKASRPPGECTPGPRRSRPRGGRTEAGGVGAALGTDHERVGEFAGVDADHGGRWAARRRLVRGSMGHPASMRGPTRRRCERWRYL